MARLVRKLKGFTIIETLTSLSLIMVSIAISFMLINGTALKQFKMQSVHFYADEIIWRLEEGDIKAESQNLEFKEFHIQIELEQSIEVIQKKIWIKFYQNEKLVLARLHYLSK